MTEILRKKWNFRGYFVSDCWALQDFFQGHKIVETREQAAALALGEGCNLNCGNTYPSLLSTIEQGLTNEGIIDRNLRELLPTRFKLGLLDPLGTVPFDSITTKVVGSQKHLDLSYEVASKSIVMLKNNDNTLPLKSDIRSLFVTGPMATNMQALLANYYGIGDNMKTLL